ncbi:PAS domain-containing protein [Candidatus Pacearchaeota archaeon]|nr:PAS domain-containing protein [Candidatus Pacearchaeota archaeon]
MSDGLSSQNANISEYIEKFRGAENFIKKIINSITGELNIVNVNTFEVEVSNSKNFRPGIKCYELIKEKSEECKKSECIIHKVMLSKKEQTNSSTHSQDGKLLKVTGYPIIDGNGNVASIIMYETDISKQTKVKENYNMLYHTMKDGFCLNEMIYENDKPIDWKILEVNDAYKNIFGNHVKNMKASEIIPNLYGKYIDHFNKAIKKDTIQKTKTPVEINDKSYEFITFKAGKDRFINLIKDVTDEHINNGKLLEIEEKFYDILQNSQDLVYRYNFREDKFDYVSESVFTILGYPLGEFMAMKNEDFNKKIHPDDLNKFQIPNTLEQEVSISLEYRFKKQNDGYVWIRGKRIIFRDEKGKLAYVIEDMRDITSEKLIEEEKINLEEKIMQIKGKELEIKERIALTDKEKIVLWGLCRYPLLNDEELSSKLNLKRSTLTAIKNRLKTKKWFSLIYLPNFHKLGCQFTSIFEGNLSKSAKVKTLNLTLIKETPEVFLNNYQDDKFFGIFVSDKFVSFKKFIDAFTEDNKDIFRMGTKENNFFYGLDSIELLGASGMVNNSFNLGMKEKSIIYNFEGNGQPLNTNEKRVLLAMVKNSEMSSAEISKKVWISKPTVIKIKKKLIDEEYIYPIIFPDFKKLGFPYVAKFSLEFDSNIPKEISKGSKDARTILRITEKKRLTKFLLLTNEEEYNEEVELLRESYRKSGIYFTLENELFPLQKRHSNNFKLEELISDLLFRDEI